MRIGIFTDTYPPFINGVSTSVVMLKKALEQKGHDVYIVTVNNENLKYKYEEDEKIVRIPGVPTGIYDYRLTGIYPLVALNKIRKWKLDVIHSQTEFSVGTFARIISKQFRIPLVHTYHTMYEDYVHYITKGYFNGASKKIVEYLTLFYCDKTISELIVPTKKAYELFKQKYMVDRNVYIVPTGIEVERFYKENNKQLNIVKKRKELGINKDDFVILFVGRIAQEKSIDTLLESMPLLIKECGKKISDTAKRCPNCGYSMRKFKSFKVPKDKRKMFFIIEGVIAIVVIVAIASTMNENKNASACENFIASLQTYVDNKDYEGFERVGWFNHENLGTKDCEEISCACPKAWDMFMDNKINYSKQLLSEGLVSSAYN